MSPIDDGTTVIMRTHVIESYATNKDDNTALCLLYTVSPTIKLRAVYLILQTYRERLFTWYHSYLNWKYLPKAFICSLAVKYASISITNALFRELSGQKIQGAETDHLQWKITNLTANCSLTFYLDYTYLDKWYFKDCIQPLPKIGYHGKLKIHIVN